jgi:hypothetical protein
VNRLTKQICLVLISSSLVLHGCGRSLTEEEKKKRQDEQAAAAGGPSSGSTYGYHPGFHWGYFGGPRFPSGATGVGVGTSHFSGTGTSPGGRSAAGASVHGGFGATGHGVSS